MAQSQPANNVFIPYIAVNSNLNKENSINALLRRHNPGLESFGSVFIFFKSRTNVSEVDMITSEVLHICKTVWLIADQRSLKSIV